MIKKDTAKLTQEQAEEIRRRYKYEEVTQAELSKEYGVSQDSISKIVRNKIYVRDHFIPEEMVVQIRTDYNAGMPYKDIEAKYHLSREMVQRVCFYGYKHVKSPICVRRKTYKKK